MVSNVAPAVETKDAIHEELCTCSECTQTRNRRRCIKNFFYVHMMSKQGLPCPEGIPKGFYEHAKKDDFVAEPKYLYEVKIPEKPLERPFSGVRRPVFLPKCSIIGLGFSRCTKEHPDGVISIFVTQKRPFGAIDPAERAPSVIAGLPVEVIQTGELVALSTTCAAGDSVGPASGGYGTFGCVVREKKHGASDRYILSNSHVLGEPAYIPQKIYHPEVGKSSSVEIAQLYDSVDIDYTQGAYNDMDAAIATVLKGVTVDPGVREIGQLRNLTIKPTDYLGVRKYGASSGDTLGFIRSTDADVNATINGQSAMFSDQFRVEGHNGPFGQAGDSGSLVVESHTSLAVGLLFTASITDNFAWATPIARVLKQWNLEIVES